MIFDTTTASMIITTNSRKAVRDAVLAVRNAVHTAASEAYALNKDNAVFAPYAAGMAAYGAAVSILGNKGAAADYAAPIAANAAYNAAEGSFDSYDAYDAAWNAVYEVFEKERD